MKYTALHAHWREVISGFLKIGAMSYGGPAIMGLMQAEFQAKRGWLSKEHFLEGLAIVTLLPGAGATQLGIFLGHARAGWWGGLLAGLCFVLPAFFIMLVLTLVYTEYGALPFMRDVFYGIGPVVLGIFIVAVYRLGSTAVGDSKQAVLAVGAALLAAFSSFGIVATLLLAGCLGVAIYHRRRAGLAAVVVLMAIYVAVRVLGAVIEPAALVLDHNAAVGVSDIALFFFGVGAFSFGGGLSMLAFMQEQVVNQMHWLTAREFLDGLALGQLTPGPILMVAAFVGYKLAGIAGALAAAAAIFLPSFLLMLALLPWLARIKQWQWMRATLKGVVPAVIGVLVVALGGMLPAAVTDIFTALIVIATVMVLHVWRVGPLPPMLAGAADARRCRRRFRRAACSLAGRMPRACSNPRQETNQGASMSRTIAPNDLKPLVEKKSVTVLDVRRQNDYDADKVKLPGAEWKNPDQLVDWSAKLPKETEIVIYCARGGSVSNSVLDALLGKGLKARFIEGGIEAWKGAGGDTIAK